MQLESFKHIWELAQDPPRKGKLEPFDAKAEGQNPLCGDWIELRIKFARSGGHDHGTFRANGGRVADEHISEARFLHNGCALSSVGASVLLDYAEGKSLAEIQKLTPEEHLKNFGAPVSPARLSCVLLALETIKSLPAENEKAERGTPLSK